MYVYQAKERKSMESTFDTILLTGAPLITKESILLISFVSD